MYANKWLLLTKINYIKTWNVGSYGVEDSLTVDVGQELMTLITDSFFSYPHSLVIFLFVEAEWIKDEKEKDRDSFKWCVRSVDVCQRNWERVSLLRQEVPFLGMHRFRFRSKASWEIVIFVFIYLFYFVFILFFMLLFLYFLFKPHRVLLVTWNHICANK